MAIRLEDNESGESGILIYSSNLLNSMSVTLSVQLKLVIGEVEVRGNETETRETNSAMHFRLQGVVCLSLPVDSFFLFGGQFGLALGLIKISITYICEFLWPNK